MHIEHLLLTGESKTLEFKQDVSSLLPIIKTIIAFANTAGGVLLIGVSNDGTVLGLTNPSDIQDKIANSVADTISPQLLVDIEAIEYQQKALVVVQVQYGGTPYYIKSEGLEKGCYVRLGATTRVASPEAIAEIQRQSKHLHFDAQICWDSQLTDFDQDLLTQYFERIQQKNCTENLLSIQLAAQHGKQILPTNAGIILFGNKAKRLQRFPNTLISCARFKGASKATFIDKLDLETDILTAVDEIPKFIRRHTLNRVVFKGMIREEIPEYPPLVVREILINAFIHANYEVLGSRFTIAIFDDRLEIQNPGILMPGMTLEHLKAGISRIRNSVLARVFRELGLVEAWGSCYERIRDICSAANCPEPIWEELGSILRVTLRPSDHEPIVIQNDAPGVIPLEKNEIQAHILSLLETHGSLSLKTLASYISPVANLRTLRYELSKLKELGYIDTEGYARGAKWKRTNLNK